MTREEWLRHAVEEINTAVFGGDLDLLNHDFQIACGRTQGKKPTECIQPYDGEDVKLEDFFPTTISVNFTIKDPIEMLTALTYECIHAFFNVKGTNNSRSLLNDTTLRSRIKRFMQVNISERSW